MNTRYNQVSKILNEAQFMDVNVVNTDPKFKDNRELARAIRKGIAAEHEATHLYEVIADKTDNKDAKKILQHIADEEKVHVGELQYLLSIIDPDNKSLFAEGEKEAEEETE